MLLDELKNEIINQNRVRLFKGKNGNDYLYDAFSQNLFPINHEIKNFLFEDDSKII